MAPDMFKCLGKIACVSKGGWAECVSKNLSKSRHISAVKSVLNQALWNYFRYSKMNYSTVGIQKPDVQNV